MTSWPPSDQPPGLLWAAHDDNEGYFCFVYRRDDPAAVAAVQEEMGEEAFARVQRAKALMANPRPLADMERAVLRQAAAPLLAEPCGSQPGACRRGCP